MAPPECVAVHPLVLLSVVDHYNRVAKDTKKRVIGILLGSVSKGEVDVTNSFAGVQPVPGAVATASYLSKVSPSCYLWLLSCWALTGRHLSQFLSRRTLQIRPSGSWTTATWRQ